MSLDRICSVHAAARTVRDPFQSECVVLGVSNDEGTHKHPAPDSRGNISMNKTGGGKLLDHS